MKVRALLVRVHGGPETLSLEDIELPPPGAGEVRVRNTAIALNYYDIYEREGLYPLDLPAVPGSESVGVVEETGPGEHDVSPGDRVAVMTGPGNYAEAMNVDSSMLVRIPAWLDDKAAAACMSKAMTVEYLLERCFPIRNGQTIVFHAAAGGVGLIACQWAKAMGARVIGTVSTSAKASIACQHGCDIAVVGDYEELVSRVMRETDGKGVPVVYDSIGRDSLDASIRCLARRGTLVSFGQASGEPDPLSPLVLARNGSLYLTRPIMADYTVNRSELVASAERVFDMIDSGAIRISIGQTYDLAHAADAQRDLVARRTTGSTVIIP